MADEQKVELTSESYVCKYCGNKSRMILIGSSNTQKQKKTLVNDRGEAVFWEHRNTLRALECANSECREINILSEIFTYYDGMSEQEAKGNLAVDDNGYIYIHPDRILYRLTSTHSEVNVPDWQIGMPFAVRFTEEFIKDKDIKKYILNDLKEIRDSFKSGLYKATIILCGSVFEALLIYALSQIKSEAEEIYSQNCWNDKNTQGKVPEVNKWHLHQLIEASKIKNIIQADGVEASNDLRNYRNLIHYNQSISRGLTAKHSTAELMIKKLEIIFEDVQRWYTNRV